MIQAAYYFTGMERIDMIDETIVDLLSWDPSPVAKRVWGCWPTAWPVLVIEERNRGAMQTGRIMLMLAGSSSAVKASLASTGRAVQIQRAVSPSVGSGQEPPRR